MKAIPTNSPCNLAAIDAPGPGGAHHIYAVQALSSDVVRLQFQRGPRGEPGSVTGLFDDDLLAVVEDRLAAFQTGDFPSSENADALAGVRAARQALGMRVARRMAQGVLGLSVVHVEAVTVPAPAEATTVVASEQPEPEPESELARSSPPATSSASPKHAWICDSCTGTVQRQHEQLPGQPWLCSQCRPERAAKPPMADILLAALATGPRTALQLLEAARAAGYTSSDSTRVLVSKLLKAGRIRRTGPGSYALPEQGASCQA